MYVPNPVLGAPDPQALGAFYAELLGWTVIENEPGWVSVEAPEARCANAWHGVSFQREEHWVPPVWPAEPGKQQMTMHLDIGVDDLDQAVAWAIEVGATLADFQPQDDVRVMRDPAGNPFCLYPRTG
jgi:catechol 2,3-dioxygenase-like lactoylglutathione lyase family enzyme